MNPTITIDNDGQGTLTITGQEPLTINTGHPDTTRQLLTAIATTRTNDPITCTINGHTTTINPDTPPTPATPAAPATPQSQPTPTRPDPHTTWDNLHTTRPTPDQPSATNGRPQLRPEWDKPHTPPTPDQPATHHTDTTGVDELFHTTNPTTNAPTHLPNRIITLANLKGGTGKTPLAVVCAQALATIAGHNDIVIVELNPRGTLSSRAPRHVTYTITDLAAACTHDTFATQPRDLDPYLSWQPEGWATIVCPPSIVSDTHGLITPITADDLDRIIAALTTRFNVIILDTGNNDLDAAWQRAITLADHIIIPIQWDPDTLTLTQNMIRDMDQIGHTNLKQRTHWVGTYAPYDRPRRATKTSYARALTDAGWNVHNLPSDRHLDTDTTIEWTKLGRRTRHAATTLATTLIQP